MLILAARETEEGRDKPAKKAKRKKVRGASHAAEGILWKALALRLAPWLEQRGAQANLARELGVSRQQVYAYFKSCTAAPDAERVLRLIVWLALAEAGAAKRSKSGRKA